MSNFGRKRLGDRQGVPEYFGMLLAHRTRKYFLAENRHFCYYVEWIPAPSRHWDFPERSCFRGCNMHTWRWFKKYICRKWIDNFRLQPKIHVKIWRLGPLFSGSKLTRRCTKINCRRRLYDSFSVRNYFLIWCLTSPQEYSRDILAASQVIPLSHVTFKSESILIKTGRRRYRQPSFRRDDL